VTSPESTVLAGAAGSLDPRLILHEIRQAGITHVITVPDTHQRSLLALLAEQSTPELVTVCTEDEAMGINLGLYLGGKRPMLLIQNSGFYAAVNTVRGLSLDAEVPAFLLIGEFFRDPARPSREQRARLVRMLEPSLDVWEIPYHRLEVESDVGRIPAAVEQAWRELGPVAVLVGGETAELS
jgi:sulfopyruvate decarboxylase subunit alpha